MISTTVVNAGLATTAGSCLKRAAVKGSNAPIRVDVMTCRPSAVAMAIPTVVVDVPGGNPDPLENKTTLP